MMGEDPRHPGQEDAMSMSGESVNQHLAGQPLGEEIGGALVPQEQGLPEASHQWLVVATGERPQSADSTPADRALVGPVLGPRAADCAMAQDPRYLGGLQGPPLAEGRQAQDPSSSMAAAASAVT